MSMDAPGQTIPPTDWQIQELERGDSWFAFVRFRAKFARYVPEFMPMAMKSKVQTLALSSLQQRLSAASA